MTAPRPARRPKEKARAKAKAERIMAGPPAPQRPLGPLVMVVKLYPTVTRERDKKSGLYITKRQHPLPSSNTYYRMKHSARIYNKAGNRFVNAAIVLDNQIKQATAIAVRRALEEAGLEDAPALVTAFCMVVVYYPSKAHRDQHNTVYKAAFDGMKNCGVWQDDDKVELYMPLAIASRHNPRIEFHIYRLPEGESGEMAVEPVPEGWEWDEALEDANDTYIT